MLSIYNRDTGRFTGTQYPEDKPAYRAHHDQYGEGGIWTIEDIVAEVVDGQPVYKYVADIALSVEAYTAEVQRTLDAKAKERNYDGILSLCTYVTSANPGFAAEGQAGVAWRDAAWAKCYEVLTEVGAGTRLQPTVAELLTELPAMDWPT